MQTTLFISSVALWVLLGLNVWATVTLIGMLKEVNQRLDALQPKGLKSGETAPSFTATTLHGKTVTLDSYTERATAFIFSVPECKHCEKAIPALNKLLNPAKQAGVDLVSVIAGEESAARTFAEQYQIQMPVLTAPLGPKSFADNYKIFAFPGYCVIDTQHLVQATGIVGDVTWERMTKQWERGTA